MSILNYPVMAYKVMVEKCYYWRCLKSKSYALSFFRKYLPLDFIDGIGNKTLFDFGCGNGRVMMMGSNLGMKCVGFDIKGSQYLKRLVGKYSDSVRIRIGDFGRFFRLGLRDIDLFTFVQVYEFMENANRDGVFYKACEMLKPNGYILFQTVNPSNMYTSKTGCKLSQTHTFFPYPTREYFMKIFERCGLEVVSEFYEGFRYPFWDSFLLKFMPYANTLCFDPPMLWKILKPQKRGFISFLLRKRNG